MQTNKLRTNGVRRHIDCGLALLFHGVTTLAYLQILVNYGHKSFNKFVPGINGNENSMGVIYAFLQ
jgi:hypothetical protein